MKRILLPLLCLATASVLADGTNQFASDSERTSYAIGMNIGSGLKRNVKQSEIDIDNTALMRGMNDALTGTPVLSDDEMKATLQKLQVSLRAKQQQHMAEQQQHMAEIQAKNKTDGEAFLTANKSKPGVITLDDGLQYQVITQGSGAMPGATDTVTVNYRGTLIDGTEFDSSYKRGQPAQFPLNQVIPAWTEAVQKMPVGSKWKLFVPSNLAYGERGSPPTIQPDSTLIFEVELLSIQAPPPPAPAPPPLTSDIIKVPSKEEMDKGAKIEVIKPEDAAKMQTNAPAGK